MQKIVAVILFILAASGAYAGSVEYSAGVGISRFTSQDGTWYQPENPYALNLASPSAFVRADYRFNPTWSVGVGYLYLGKASSYAEASADDGEYPNGVRPSCTGQCWPHSHWYGYGDVKGVFLEGRYTHRSGFYAEAGVYAYKPTWHEYIPDWRACADCAPSYVEVSHDPQIQFSPIYGIGYREGRFGLSLQQVWANASKNSAGSFPAVYDKYTTSFYLTYTLD